MTKDSEWGWSALVLPHPSGLSRGWNAPGSYERARRAVLELAPELASVVGSDLA